MKCKVLLDEEEYEELEFFVDLCLLDVGVFLVFKLVEFYWWIIEDDLCVFCVCVGVEDELSDFVFGEYK